MRDYSLLQGIFGSVFSSDLGRSDQEAEALFKEMLKNQEYRDKVEAVLNSAFSDREFSWINAFDQYEVYSTEDEADAREYAKKILWDVVFPRKNPPNLF